MRQQLNIGLIAVMVISAVIYSACKKTTSFEEAPVPGNPFDTITYPGPVPKVPVDSHSFLGLHTYIFSTTCAVPGCHDGHFEPDFRTVESAYNTLVFHDVEKNNASNSFEYRVVPGNSAESWLHERITTDDQVLGRMPLYDTLSKHEIALIKEWIDDGAKDAFGNSPTQPNLVPTFFGILAFENDTNGIRLDTGRASIIDPMPLPNNTTVDIWVGMYDVDANGQFMWGNDLTYNKYKISPDLYDFGNVSEQSLIVEAINTRLVAPNPFSTTGEKAWYFQHFKINTANYSLNKPYYFRVYVQDADHSQPTELPTNGSPLYLLTYFSFVVK